MAMFEFSGRVRSQYFVSRLANNINGLCVNPDFGPGGDKVTSYKTRWNAFELINFDTPRPFWCCPPVSGL